LNAGRRGGNPATNPLSYGAAPTSLCSVKHISPHVGGNKFQTKLLLLSYITNNFSFPIRSKIERNPFFSKLALHYLEEKLTAFP
jgi:hypothetical protein